MVSTTTNESFQLFADGETPWEHRSDFEKLDNIFGGARTVDAFDTDKLTVGSGDDVLQIEHGTVSNDPGASTNDDFSDRATNSTTVSFSTTFDSAPRVLVSQQAAIRGYISDARAITTSDCKIQTSQYAANDFGAVTVAWLAIGP